MSIAEQLSQPETQLMLLVEASHKRQSRCRHCARHRLRSGRGPCTRSERSPALARADRCRSACITGRVTWNSSNSGVRREVEQTLANRAEQQRQPPGGALPLPYFATAKRATRLGLDGSRADACTAEV